ncbi:MAG TPA: amino acid adenylation domain-containing protein [Chthonomonadaceae bacterium]|nr:amino acid adenylation domain-containing protein [Chthonomonadaceae bacterium]
MAGDTIAAMSAAETPTEGLEGFEISPQQRRTWLFHRDARVFNARISVEIEGALDLPRLKQAAEAIAAKYEILRTTFRHVPGRLFPVQVIHDRLSPEWQEVGLEHLAPAAQQEPLRQYLEEQLPLAFSFERGPLFRLGLLRLSAQRSLLSLCLPALCADPTTLRILVRELAACYAGDAHGEEEPLQYADIADWQNELLEDSTSGDAGHAYWRQQDTEAPAASFPSERALAGDVAFHIASFALELNPNTWQTLQETAAHKEVPPAAILAGCWQTLLSRLSGTRDLLVHHILDGRPAEDLENAVGPLAKWIPIPVGIDASIPAARLWRRTKKAMGDGTHWQLYWNGGSSAAEGREEVTAAERIGFQFEAEPEAWTADGLNLTFHSQAYCLEPFKLQLSCLARPDGLTLEFACDARRFQEQDLRQLADYFLVLLDSALGNSDAAVGSLPMLPEAERRKLLVEWNDTQRDYPSVAAIHHLFEQAAQSHPDAALVYADQQLSYEALNRRANQLAHHLQALGVVPDMPVGLYLERSLDLIVGLLGILKAGGAYLPLDPALPHERLTGMLADSGARLLVSGGALPELGGVACVHLNRDAEAISQQSEANPQSAVEPHHLAYVIYTSGSTGRPKGVGIEHHQLLNYVQGVSERLELPAGASYATVSTIAADLGNTMVFPALCLGGCLHVIPSDTAMDAGAWREYLKQHRIDCLKIVPSHLSALLGSGAGAAEALPRAILVLGGEASSWDLVGRIRAASPALRVYNHYGPTETTVGVLTYAVGEARPDSLTVPLGRPLPNSRMYVLNEVGEPVPVGVLGELYIGGAGVGRGYLGREELTAEKFVEDRFAAEAGARMYRTGDVVRYLADGNLEFLGRVDHQVKIRGYRIELGEIESVLLEHPRVREAVVLAREDGTGEKRLVGYVVGTDGTIAAGELREYLGGKLPGYMTPSALVCLARLPLTANGKVDRNALPAPEALEEQLEYVGPANALEEVLASIWEELLRRERISMNQNFFDLGGHSLLATQVISRVRETFEVDPPLRALFDAPTIASFAALMVLDPETRPDIEQMAEMLVSLSGLSEAELEERLRNLEPNETG